MLFNIIRVLNSHLNEAELAAKVLELHVDAVVDVTVHRAPVRAATAATEDDRMMRL